MTYFGSSPANSPSASCWLHGPEITSHRLPEESELIVPIRIRAHMFFDGTLNNMFNTNERIQYDADRDPDAGDAWFWQRETVFDKDADNSYQNDLTNIALLYNFSPDQKNEYAEKEFSIYIEGIGTSEKDEDDSDGYAFGSGSTGITTRVSNAIDKLIANIEDMCWEKFRPISIEISSFGFSRGAAAARHFIHQVLTGEKGLNLKRRLVEQHSYTLASDPVVKFAGLFDTVSSFHPNFSISPNFSNDVSELHLTAVSLAEEAVHLVAADEHRVNFSLTNIKSCGNKGKEIFLPGVHSDIGGSYRDPSHETELSIFKLPMRPGSNIDSMSRSGNYLTPWEMERIAREIEQNSTRMKKEVDWLIEQGWCDRQRLSRDDDGFQIAEVQGNSIRVTRRNLKNSYSRIPLHMMAEFGQKKFVAFKMPEIGFEKPITGLPKEHESKVRNYASKMPRLQNTGVAPPSWLRSLRREFFHCSSHYTRSAVVLTPMEPNFCLPGTDDYGTSWNHIMNGERRRRIYDG